MSLWGTDFEIAPKENKEKILKKISKPKKVVSETTVKTKITKQLKKDKEVDPYSFIPSIQEEVYRILGKYKDNTVVIKDIESFKNYIDIAIKNGSIAVDTETNNSLDPLTCKLMGLCIYLIIQKMFQKNFL